MVAADSAGRFVFGVRDKGRDIVTSVYGKNGQVWITFNSKVSGVELVSPDAAEGFARRIQWAARKAREIGG